MSIFTRYLFFLVVISLASFSAIAQEVAALPLPYEDFFAYLFKNIGGFKGASSMAVGLLVAQMLVKLFETKVGNLIGKWKMTAIGLLTLIIGVIGMALTTDVSIVTALFSSANLVLLQGFAHQTYKQFIEKED